VGRKIGDATAKIKTPFLGGTETHNLSYYVEAEVLSTGRPTKKYWETIVGKSSGPEFRATAKHQFPGAREPPAPVVTFSVTPGVPQRSTGKRSWFPGAREPPPW
jgi:hypothetical protein